MWGSAKVGERMLRCRHVDLLWFCTTSASIDIARSGRGNPEAVNPDRRRRGRHCRCDYPSNALPAEPGVLDDCMTISTRRAFISINPGTQLGDLADVGRLRAATRSRIAAVQALNPVSRERACQREADRGYYRSESGRYPDYYFR